MIKLPDNGTYKVIEDEAKKVQTTLNQWRHLYDIYHLSSQFKDRISGSVLSVLVYLVEKPKGKQPVPGNPVVTADAKSIMAAANLNLNEPPF